MGVEQDRPFRSEDHDILISVKTTLDLLYAEFQRLKENTRTELALKADKSELMELARRMEELQKSEKEDIEALREWFDKSHQESLRENSKLKWFVAIGIGIVLSVNAILPFAQFVFKR